MLTNMQLTEQDRQDGFAECYPRSKEFAHHPFPCGDMLPCIQTEKQKNRIEIAKDLFWEVKNSSSWGRLVHHTIVVLYIVSVGRNGTEISYMN